MNWKSRLEKEKAEKEIQKLDEELKLLRRSIFSRSTFWVPFISTVGIVMGFVITWSSGVLDFKKIENRTEALLVKLEVEAYEKDKTRIQKQIDSLTRQSDSLAYKTQELDMMFKSQDSALSKSILIRTELMKISSQMDAELDNIYKGLMEVEPFVMLRANPDTLYGRTVCITFAKENDSRITDLRRMLVNDKQRREKIGRKYQKFVEKSYDRTYVSSYPRPSAIVDDASLYIGIPRFFSPNHDGVNDLWTWSPNPAYANASVLMFNHAGQSVYQSSAYNNSWDGKSNGQPLQAGNYYYVIRLADLTELRGAVRIIR